MKNQPDQFLIDKTLYGDTRAFGLLIEKYQDYIFTVVYRMIKVREEAEEIVQDTFLKAYEALPTFRGESKFSTWLYRIAYRKTLDRLRKGYGLTTSEVIEEITGNAVENLENGLELMLQEERSDVIKKCLLQLPEQEAAIITLYYFEEQSVREIAEVTELSEDNIKIKLYRSRKLLFTLLENYMKPEIAEKNGKAV